MLTQEQLKELVTYEPKTGVFRWRFKHGKVYAGQIAGTVTKRGHIVLHLDYKYCAAHRLAWLYMTGSWPKDQIDHKDCNPGNNRWVNLREATNSQNHCNKPRQPNNTSGYKGVYLDKRRGVWYANIKKLGKVNFLGSFPTAKAAYLAYLAAIDKFHGEFARPL